MSIRPVIVSFTQPPVSRPSRSGRARNRASPTSLDRDVALSAAISLAPSSKLFFDYQPFDDRPMDRARAALNCERFESNSREGEYNDPSDRRASWLLQSRCVVTAVKK